MSSFQNEVKHLKSLNSHRTHLEKRQFIALQSID